MAGDTHYNPSDSTADFPEGLGGRRILVAGATGGLGSVTARALCHAGADVILSGRDTAKLEALIAELPRAEYLAADLNDPEGLEHLASAVGELDGCVVAAGIAPVAPLRFLRDVDLEAVFAANTLGPLRLTRALLRGKRLRRGASLVWFSSLAAARGAAGYTAYAASKAALEGAARCLALELAPKAMRVNCIAAGMIRSALASEGGERFSEESLQAHFDRYPLGEGSAADVAGTARFLLSDASRWTTGAVLPVDGGFSAQ